MLLVGLEFPLTLFKTRVRAALAVSLSGMLAPFVLGALLAAWLVHLPGLFAPSVSLPQAGLFLGAALAITAFPVLARIVRERELAGTWLGALALAAGAFDDVAAWCGLAVVSASFGGTIGGAVTAIGGAVVYAALLLTVGRRLLLRLDDSFERTGVLTSNQLSLALVCFAGCAFAMDFVGVHAVFGAFLLGVAMPRGRFADELKKTLDGATSVLLVPMFFAYSGLNTRLDLFDRHLLLVTGAILGAACLGKAVACWAAARLTGTDRNTAVALGALMNARGTMELIMANLGLEMGIITPALFSVLVTMAVLTTLMVSPVFTRVLANTGASAPPLEAARGGV
jgi:Kef-type K+ transport system membrane component KefB